MYHFLVENHDDDTTHISENEKNKRGGGGGGVVMEKVEWYNNLCRHTTLVFPLFSFFMCSAHVKFSGYQLRACLHDDDILNKRRSYCAYYKNHT